MAVTVVLAYAVLIVFATQCAGDVLVSTVYAPYSVSIGEGAATRGPVIVAESPDGNWKLQLEFDALNRRCAVALRHLYTDPIARNVWTANYFSKTSFADPRHYKCSLEFTKEGDLQLYTVQGGRTLLAWNSRTANRGVTKMVLTKLGDFQILTTTNKAVFSSFEWKEFAILETQQLRLWESLKSPDMVQYELDNDTRVLLNKGEFVLAFDRSRDLVLRTTDTKPLVYWSLKRTLFKGGDLSQVAYAAVNPGDANGNGRGGVGLFTKTGKTVWKSTLPLQGYFGAAYFGIDKFGNLNDYFLYKGVYWGTQFQAITNDCDLPNFCGHGSLCQNSHCFCPPRFVRTAGSDITSTSCKYPSKLDKCKWKSFVKVAGYDTVFDLYAAPLKVSLASCEVSCVKSCMCAGFSYHTKTGSCFQYEAFKTIRYANDNSKFVYLKVA